MTTIRIKKTGEIKEANVLKTKHYETIDTDSDMSSVYLESEVELIDPVVEKNIDMLRQRSKLGIEKYGTTLHDNLTDDFIKHALEEVLDLANYLQAHLMKKPSK